MIDEVSARTGLDILGDLPWGAHFCQFYQTDRDLIEILLPYFNAGLKNNEFCIWVTSESESPAEQEAEKAVRRIAPNLDRRLRGGQIQIIPHTHWHPEEAPFDLVKTVRGWLDKVNAALARGYEGIRIMSDMTWVEKKDWGGLADYEQELNDTIGGHRIIVTCAYSLSEREASEVIDVVSNHQFALIKREGEWEVIESSEQKRTREALRESEEKYRTIFEDSLEAMSLIRKGKIADVNPAWLRLHGFENKEEVIGIDVINIIHPEDRPILARRRTETCQNRPRVFQVRDLRKDGAIVDVEVYSSAIRLGGEPAILSTVRDNTQYKLLQEELIREAKLAALGTMVAGVAHELNSPLTAICGYSSLLVEDKSLPESARRDLEHVASEASRCARIVGDLLRFARRGALTKEMADLNELMASIVDLRRHDMRVSNMEIVEQYDPSLPPALVNAQQLQQVFLNVINNACDAIRDHNCKGKIFVRTKRTQERIAVEIEDNGGGLKEPHRLFEPFYTTKEAGKGTGLGLSVAYGIMQDHGGSIAAANIEGGTRFTICLPIQTEAAPRKEEWKPHIKKDAQTPSTEWPVAARD